MKSNPTSRSWLLLCAGLAACNGNASGSGAAGVASELTAVRGTSPASSNSPQLLTNDPAAPRVAPGAPAAGKPCLVKPEKPKGDDEEDGEQNDDSATQSDDDSVDKSKSGASDHKAADADDADDESDEDNEEADDDEHGSPAPCAPGSVTPPAPAADPSIR